MKSITFAFRCSKEIMRDPINMVFGAGIPLILLFLLSAIQSRIPNRVVIIKNPDI